MYSPRTVTAAAFFAIVPIVAVSQHAAIAACSPSSPLVNPDFDADIVSWTLPADASWAAPQDAVAALVELRATKSSGSASSTVTANFDDVAFTPAGAAHCADPVCPFNKVTADDALLVLRASVGARPHSSGA
ncbi:MAG TPA: hypothetical protein VGK20_00235 [Candidatus Binatia bacterium]